MFDSLAHVIGAAVSKLSAARAGGLTGGDIPQNVNFVAKGGEALDILRANSVQPAVMASTGPEKRADEIDAVAKASTVHLPCFH